MIVVVGITGFTGRMGQAIAQTIDVHPNACLAGGVTRPHTVPPADEESPLIITDNPQELFPQCDVIVDFSHPSVVPIYARLAAEAGKAFMSGTTGLEEETLSVFKETAKKVPVLYASNTSLSLVVTKQVAKLTAKLLKDYDYDVSILDKHHKWKKDAPSGTALSLGKSVLEGNKGKKMPSFASVRSGSIIGEHEILFAGKGDTITLHHSVTDRRIFAQGAVHAAIWLSAQKVGFYSMEDVLQIDVL